MIDAASYGAPNWVDLTTPHLEEATRFYEDMFDWSVTTMETPMGEYHVASIGRHPVGGLMGQNPEAMGARPAWTMFVHVRDVDETLDRVEDAAGRVHHQPTEIPGGAIVSVVSDPTGGILAVVSGGATPEGPYLTRLPGGVCWFELLTREPVRARPFYEDVFGWLARTERPRGHDYTVFSLEGEDVAGMMDMPGEITGEVPAHWSVYFSVDSCARAATRALELGGHVMRPPTPVGPGTFAVLADPQGATFDVLEFAA